MEAGLEEGLHDFKFLIFFQALLSDFESGVGELEADPAVFIETL